MPTLNDMLSNMDMHKNFYIRGVVNSLLPEFMNPLDREITENNISGESLEALRTVATTLYPDMKDGEVEQIGLDEILSVFKVDDQGDAFKTHMSLGTFGLTKINGEYTVIDTYDFEPMGGIEFVKKFANNIGGGGINTALPEFIGGVLMPENPDGTSREDALKVRIRIPDEPQVVDMDFDNDIEPTASTFVFEGPMTNKRKKLWDTFTSMFITPAEAQTRPSNDNVDLVGLNDLRTSLDLMRAGKAPFPMDGSDEYGRMNAAQRAIADEGSIFDE